MSSSLLPPHYLGITVQNVIVKLNGTIQDPPDRITLHDHENSFSFYVTFPECEFRRLAPKLTFQYDSEENCKMEITRSKEHFAVTKIDAESNGFASLNDGTVKIVNRVYYGYENYQNEACPPRFKNGKLFFKVLDVSGGCNFTLGFGKNPLGPDIVTTTFETVAFTTEAPPGLSGVAFWLLVIGGPVVGVLLLIGLGAFLYWFLIYRKRRARQSKKKLPEGRGKFYGEFNELVKGQEELQKKQEEESEAQAKGGAENNSLAKLFSDDDMWVPRPWEAKLKNGGQLDSEEYHDKEKCEADWRWIHRRNVAYDVKEPYQVDPVVEANKKKLMDEGNVKKMRELESFVPRPELYKRRNDEKQAAAERYKYRVNKMTPPTYEELGCHIAENEHDIIRPYPKPMDEDWIASSNRYTSAGSTGE